MIFIRWHGSLDLMGIILILMPWNAPNYTYTHWVTVLTLTTPNYQHLLLLNASPEILGLKTMEPISKILWWLEFPPVAIRFAGYNCMGQFTTLTCSGILFISLPLSDIMSLCLLYDLKKNPTDGYLAGISCQEEALFPVYHVIRES